jgi:hypothetical protein
MEHLNFRTIEELGDFIRNHPEDYAFHETIIAEAEKARRGRRGGVSKEEVNRMMAASNVGKHLPNEDRGQG